jgi:lysophospholipase L1-like esterase
VVLSRAYEPFDGADGFGELGVAFGVAFESRLHDAMTEVFVDETNGDAQERAVQRGTDPGPPATFEVIVDFVPAVHQHLHLMHGPDLFGPDDVADLPDGLHPNAAGYQRMGERFHQLAFQDGPFRE